MKSKKKLRTLLAALLCIVMLAGVLPAATYSGRRSGPHRHTPFHHRCLPIQNGDTPGPRNLDLGYNALPAQCRGKAGV